MLCNWYLQHVPKKPEEEMYLLAMTFFLVHGFPIIYQKHVFKTFHHAHEFLTK